MKRACGRVVIVVAVALIAHVWMLNTSMVPTGMDSPAEHAPVLIAPATPDLPATTHCAVGRSACLVHSPDDRPAAVTLALLVALGGFLWRLPLPVPAPDLARPRAWARHARCPPQPCVPASVVLLQ